MSQCDRLAACMRTQVTFVDCAVTISGTRPFEEVPVTAEQVLADAATLSVSERLRIVQAIWDSLPENVLPTPGSDIKSEFDRRMQNYRQNPASAMTLDELRRRLDADRTE